MASQENTASNTNPTPSNTVTTEVKITKYETADKTDAGEDVTEDTSTLYNHCDYGQGGNNSADAAYTQTLEESGYYVMTVTATDAAGNTATWEKTIKLDVVAPTAGSVTYTDADTGSTSDGLRGLIRKLSFGLFYNKAVDVTVTFTDDLSGIGTKAIYYEKIAADGTFTGSGTELTVATTEGTEIVYSATIPLTVNNTSGYIRYWAVDNAGNVSAYYNLGYDLTDADDTTSTSTVDQILWKLENTSPTISALSATDGTHTDKLASGTTDTEAATSGAATWLTASTGATVSATIEDDGSGLYSVTASYLYVDSFDKISQLEDPDTNNLTSTTLAGTCYTDDGYGTKAVLGDDASATSAVNTAYWKADTALTNSGVYKVTISAVDNATNKSEDYTLYVYVDATAPVVEVSYNDSTHDWVNNSATNQYITVNFTVTETTSKTKSVTVTGTTGTQALRNASGEAVDSITLNVNSTGEYSFNAYANDTFTITVTDYAGNTNVTTSDTTNPVTVSKIDLVDPVYASLTVNSEGFSGEFNVSTNYYTSDDITFTITASDSISGLSTYQVFYNQSDSTSGGSVLLGAGGNWTQTSGKDDESVTTGKVTQSGTYYVYVVLTDMAGNTYTSGTTQIRLENGSPSAYIYSYIYNNETWSETAEGAYNPGDWINDDGVVAIVTSGLEAKQATYYYAVNTGVSSGSDVTSWNEITFTNGTYSCAYGTFTLTIDTNGAEIIRFVTTLDGSNSYYFKVENSTNKTKVGYATLTVNLDHKDPSNATLSDPSSAATNGWYSTAPTFTLTDVTDAYKDSTLADEGIASSAHTIKYLLTQMVYDTDTEVEVTAIKSDSGVVSQAISDSTTTLTTTAPTADGTWYLYYWVEDGATNSSAIARETIQVDTTKPTIGDYEVTYSDGSTPLNILTFGVFGNQSYTVTVKLSDNLSGVGSMTYTVSSDSSLNGDAIITYYTDSNYSDTSATMTCYATATFTIGGEFTDGTITMTAHDYAGNNSEVATLTAETQDEKKVTSWTYTTKAPQVELTWKDQVNTLGWMNSNTATVDMTVTENAAGLREVYYALSGATDKIDTYLLTQSDTSGEDQKTQKYEEGTFTLDSLGEGITTLTVTAVSNAGVTGSNTVDIKVDTDEPTYSTEYTTDQSWTNENETITFTLEDTTSGVRYDTIKVYSVSTENGTETDDPVNTTINNAGTNVTDSQVTANTKYEVRFIVSENGYYYIVAEDMAGNRVEKWITVNNVDETKPETPEISVSGSTNSEGWYNAYETVTFTATANSGFAYAAETLVWQVLDSTGTIFESGYSSTIENGSITCTYTFTEDGEYTLLAYMKDAAGNYSTNVTSDPTFTVSGTKDVQVDTTSPTFTADSIVVKDHDGTATITSVIANFFSFGNYISTEEGIQISITTKDDLSGVDTTKGYYKLSTDDSTDNSDENNNYYTGKATITQDGDAWTYTITLESSALENESTIKVWVYDVAGNKAANYELAMYNDGKEGSENWQIDTVNPTISVKVDGTFGDSENTSGKTYASGDTGTTYTDRYYYYSKYPTLSLTADDGQQSGLYTVSAYVEYTKPGETQASSTTYLFGSTENVEKDYSSSSDVTEKTSSATDSTYTINGDGTYKIYATVVDNANNTANITVTILVDKTAPEDAFTVQEDGSTTSTNLDSVDFTGTTNWKTKNQIISFTLTDNFSKVDVSTIELTATGISGTTPELTDVTSANAAIATGSFTITENGTYTLTWKDVAGNESSKEIVVSNLDTTNPDAPSVTVSLLIRQAMPILARPIKTLQRLDIPT
ncbi:MAG: hypothetical protein LUC32_08950 [Clostridiales bacterium]|nr:hypothetical protein [Clostridiales bacterium]